jgi:ATP-binding cassette subfamily B protein
MNAIISEMLSLNGVLLVKLFGRQTDNRRKYEATVDQVAETTLKNNVVGVIFVTVIGIVSAGTVLWLLNDQLL